MRAPAPHLRPARRLLVLLALFLPLPATAATIHVPGQQPTIQAAIDAAAPGDTILVAPGDYRESLRLTDKINLTIEAASGSYRPIIHGTANKSDDGIRIDFGVGITLRGLDIDGTYDGVRLNDVEQAVLDDLHITDSALGIKVNGGRDNSILDCTVIGTRVEQGILVDNGDRTVIAGTLIGDTAVEGLRVLTSEDVLLADNDVSGSRAGIGIRVHRASNASIIGNTASDNAQDGFRLTDSPNLELIDNGATDNVGVGIRVEDCFPFMTVEEVLAFGNTASGDPQGDIVVRPARPLIPTKTATSTPTPPPTATPTRTPTRTLTPTKTLTATPLRTPTQTPPPTAIATGPTRTATVTPLRTATATSLRTATVTRTATPTRTRTPTPTRTPTATVTADLPPGGYSLLYFRFSARITRTNATDQRVDVPVRSTHPPIPVFIMNEHVSAFAPNAQVRYPQLVALGGDTLDRLTASAAEYILAHPVDYPNAESVLGIDWAKRANP